MDAPPDSSRGSKASLVCFRSVSGTLRENGADLTTVNERQVERVELDGKTFLSCTVCGGSFSLRACIVNYRASAIHIEKGIPVSNTGLAESFLLDLPR